MTEIHYAIAAVAAALPAVWIEVLAKGIETASSSADWPSIIAIANLNDGTGVLGQLGNIWESNPQISPQAVAVSLRSVVAAQSTAALHQTIELVWTGPATSYIPMRRTEQVAQQVIDAACHRLLISSFAFVNPEGIAANLHSAANRGVEIIAILEPPKSRGGAVDHDPAANLAAIVPSAIILEWTPGAKVRSGLQITGCIHAKMILADVIEGFITSANFTGSALERNMELGTHIIGGNHLKMLSNHFDTLIARGYFDRR